MICRVEPITDINSLPRELREARFQSLVKEVEESFKTNPFYSFKNDDNNYELYVVGLNKGSTIKDAIYFITDGKESYKTTSILEDALRVLVNGWDDTPYMEMED